MPVKSILIFATRPVSFGVLTLFYSLSRAGGGILDLNLYEGVLIRKISLPCSRISASNISRF